MPLTFLGRAAGCDVRLNVEGLNPLHCLIAYGPAGVLVRDLESEHGTSYQALLCVGALAEAPEFPGWTAEVLSVVRPARRPTVVPDRWTAGQLRKSHFLMPSQLVECDLEELWWLGDTRNRERLPDPWGRCHRT